MNYSDPNESWLPSGYDPYKDMTDDERFETGCLQSILFILGAVASLLVCALLCGCSTVRDTTTLHTATTDTVYITQQLHDSIYRHDSVAVVQWQAGDTVYLTRDRWHTRYVERTRTDTLWRDRTQTVFRDRTEHREQKVWPTAFRILSWVAVTALLFGLGCWLWLHRRRQ